MKKDKYLIHDVYHVTKNLEIMEGVAELKKIIKYSIESGERNKKNYTEKDIKDCINYFERIRMIKQVRKEEYVCLN